MTALRGELKHNEPMARHTSWRVGGPVDVWYRPADLPDLQHFLAQQSPPYLWLGLGSNLLVRDGGFRGAAVTVYDALTVLERHGALRVRVGAGVHCARLAKFCAAQGLSGGAFFAGIPGSVGGALAMNAGAFGGETWERVRAVTVLDPKGGRHQLGPEAFDVAYRHVDMPIADALFVEAELAFEQGDAAEEAAAVRELLARRRASQPVGQPSCGSVFRNPPGAFAAELIEAAGLKGAHIGGAQVAHKHANFILNTGDATAADIEALIEHVRATVRERSGVELQPEVRIVGEAA